MKKPKRPNYIRPVRATDSAAPRKRNRQKLNKLNAQKNQTS